MTYVNHKLIGIHAWMVVWISKKGGFTSFNSWVQMVVLVVCLSRLPLKLFIWKVILGGLSLEFVLWQRGIAYVMHLFLYGYSGT